MTDASKFQSPRPYDEWRIAKSEREEDAAYTFGADLIRHCRDAVIADVLKKGDSQSRDEAVQMAVDTALHNVLDLLEGFWPTSAGANHPVEYALVVRVRNQNGDVVEEVPVSPGRVDLPLGYWKWRGREFR